ncbi:hypothetical protein, partial [Marinomonas transparens]
GELKADNITLTATALNNTGSKGNIQAKDSLVITLQGDLVNKDGAKIQTSSESTHGQLTIEANRVTNQSILAANQLTILAAQLDNRTANASIYGIDKVDLTLTGQLNNTDNALIQSDNQLIIDADGNITNSSATLAS